jgi:uncharacterized membrane protein
MQGTPAFTDRPNEYEAERASNSYLMALVALMVGLPLPVINLIATGIFFFSNRKASHFVRWHCTQALLAQAFTLVINVCGVYWTISVAFGNGHVTNDYLAYILTIVLFNLIEFIATMYTAIQTRKGYHVSWYFFGTLTDALVGR